MDIKIMTIEDALKAGISKDEIRKTINDILDSFDDTKETHTCGKCENCSNDDIEETDLDIAREDVLIAVLDYLYALGFIDDDIEITDELFDELVDIIKDVEEECVAKLALINVFEGLGNKDKHKSSDDIIADFIKKLH